MVFAAIQGAGAVGAAEQGFVPGGHSDAGAVAPGTGLGVDCYVSPRIAYWLSSFEPEMEAVAGEVACLRRSFPGSIAWGIGPRNWMNVSWRRGFGLHPRLHLAFRAATWLCQKGFHINHLFGGLGDWFHLKAVRKSPVVLTLAIDGHAADARLLDKVDRFVAEWPGAQDRLQAIGVEPARIRQIFPPVDLERFRPAPPPQEPFTVLFASSPDNAAWLEARGVPLLLETAALRPAMRFRLVWRPWGDSLATVEKWIRERGLSNVDLAVGRFADMAPHYRESHATVAPFLQSDRCKPAPNSLIESLASGRPVALTESVGLAEFVRDQRAGIVFAPNAEALAEGLDTLRADWTAYSDRARRTAERWFGVERFIGSYRALYEELT
jgi:glycosyltransferase involved in cell wall biosynthesis